MGAPPGNRNAEKHGFYALSPDAVTINDAISGLVDKMRRLDEIIAGHEAHDAFLVSVFTIYTQALSRLARLHSALGTPPPTLSAPPRQIYALRPRPRPTTPAPPHPDLGSERRCPLPVAVGS